MPAYEKASESSKDQTLAVRLYKQKKGTLKKKNPIIYSNTTTICMYKCLFTQRQGRH